MRMLFSGTGLIIAVVCGISLAYGQKATERFIPMGQSPGLSYKYTYMGSIDRVDKQRRSITAGGQTTKITGKTQIWLDRTKLRLSNQVGSFADLRPGQAVEIKYEDPERKDIAEWIKLEATQP